MKASVIVPIHDKPAGTVAAVLESLQQQEADQVIIVLDRARKELADLASACDRAEIVTLDGPEGWRSPCISFNAGLERVTGDITIINHSDVVQASGNVAFARDHFAQHPDSVLFAKVLESNPENLTGSGNAGPVLCSSLNTRALTFLTAIPTRALRAIGGWDVAFQAGVCYEDDDLTARLWKHGLDFHFDDRFHGVHMTHSRAYFFPRTMAINETIMLDKHGAPRVTPHRAAYWKLEVTRENDKTTWTHTHRR